ACVNDSEFVHSDGQTYCTAGCENQTLCYTEPIPEKYLVWDYVRSRSCKLLVDALEHITTRINGLFRSFSPSHSHTQKPCREIKNGVPRIRGKPGSGLSNADILLIVDADASDMCKNELLGFAMTCQVDDSLDR
ncbi:hypothetical protein PHET_10532, partial [Paragonimus heterotremus]